MAYTTEKYRVFIAQSGKQDIKERKQYILEHFQYRELAENFSRKMKKAMLSLETFPRGYEKTGFRYRGFDIYIKPVNTYLLLFTVNEKKKSVIVLRVLQDGMNWKYVIGCWLKGKV